jgi:hypothetical protein
MKRKPARKTGLVTQRPDLREVAELASLVVLSEIVRGIAASVALSVVA